MPTCHLSLEAIPTSIYHHLQRSNPASSTKSYLASEVQCILLIWILPLNTAADAGRHRIWLLLHELVFLFSSYDNSDPPAVVKHLKSAGHQPLCTYRAFLIVCYEGFRLSPQRKTKRVLELVYQSSSSGIPPLTQPMSSSRRVGTTGWQAPVTPPALVTAMETAMAGAAEVSRVGRRIIQKIWDPEPVNNRVVNEPVWCLGCSYTLDTKTYGSPPASSSATSTSPPNDTIDFPPTVFPQPCTNNNTPDTPPDSVASSFDSSLAYEDPGQDGGWPPAFLDDFESRIWMTYRNAFDPIPRSTDPKAATHLSFTMRLRTSLGDQNGGFSSDTGWGCMIRSGQSLLANAISVIRLGRGKHCQTIKCWDSSNTSSR